MTDALHKVARDGAILGDYTFAAIRSGIADGSLRPTDHVWAPGQGRWILLGELAALAKPPAPAGAARPAAASGLAAPAPHWLALPFIGVSKGIGHVLGALGTIIKWVFVIGLGLFIGMILEGRSPRRHPENDPLSDPYAGRRDRDFDDPYRDV